MTRPEKQKNLLSLKEWAITIILALSLSLFLPNISFSGGPIHGARATGMGTAFVAIADDPSAITHNPAGLTQLKGTNIYSGVTAVITSTDYESPTGGSEDTEFQVFFPPHLYISSDLNTQNMAVGLGVYSPFGIGGRKWNENGPTRYISTEYTIATFNINPTFAWQITPGISVGFGVFYLYAFNTAERMIDQSSLGARDGKSSIDADGDGWGYNFGIIVTPFQKLSLGFAFRSGVKVDQSGDIELKNIAPALQAIFGGSQFKTNVHTTLDFPDVVSLGLAYRPTEKLTLGLDFEWVGWSSFDEQNLDFENEVPGGGFSDASTLLDWKDIWSIKAGGEYWMTDSFALRAGYVYVDTIVPGHTLSPVHPDSVQHNFSIGCGYKIKQWILDAFYNAGFYEDRKVNNPILSGSYENFTHYFGLSIGYRF